MIPLTASFITRSMAHPTTSRSMTQVFALLPRATDDVTAVVSSQSSIPFTLMSAFAMAISYADRSNLSTAVIPMAAAFHWDSFFSGFVLSAFWAGYALTQILGGKLADKYGGEKLLVFAMIVWSACTALTPTAAALGSIPIISIRILLGAGEGLALPAIHSMIRKYVLPAQRSTSAAIVTAACYLGALSSNLLSPMIISHFSWESCFLLFAAIPPLIWIPLWALFLGRKGVGISGSSSEKNTEYLISKISSDSNVSYIENGKNSEVDGSYVKLSRKVPVSESTAVGATSPQRTLTYADVTSEQSTTQSTYAAESTYSSENLQIYLAEEVCESDIVSDTAPLINSNSEKEGKGKIWSIERGDKVHKQKQEQEQEGKQDKTLSIRTLLKSPPVWAIIAAQYGQSWGAIGLLSWLPTYYSKRFNVPFESLSEFTVLPYFLQMIVGVSAGFLADKLIGSGVRTLLVRNILQITGMLVPAVCLALCAYLPSLSSAQAAILITSGSAISALTVAAVSANHFDISPENAGTIYGIGNTAGCIGGLIAVPVSGFLYDNTHNWDAVFLLFAFHYLGGAFLWSLWSSDQPLKNTVTSGIEV